MDTIVETSENSASDVGVMREASQELLDDLVQSLTGLTPAVSPRAAAPVSWHGVTDYSTLEEGAAVIDGSGEPEASLYTERYSSFPSSLFGSSLPDGVPAVTAVSSHPSSNELMYSEMDTSVSGAASFDMGNVEESSVPEKGMQPRNRTASRGSTNFSYQRPTVERTQPRVARVSAPARTKSQYSLRTAETGVRLLEIAVRSPLAQVVSKSGRAVRKRELSALLTFQRQHPDTGITRLQLESPLLEGPPLVPHSFGSGNRASGRALVQMPDSAPGTRTEPDTSSRFRPPSVASMLELHEHEVDDYLFHPDNTAEIDMIDKTLKVLEYAKEPLRVTAPRKTAQLRAKSKSAAAPANVSESDATHFEQTDKRAAQKPGSSDSSMTRAELHRRMTEDRKAEQLAKVAEVQAAESEWEQQLAATVLKVFHSDLSRRTLGDPEEASKFYFQPTMTGSADPMGRRVKPPKLPNVALKEAVVKDATMRKSLTGQSVLPKIASPTRSGPSTGCRLAPRETEIAVLDAERHHENEDVSNDNPLVTAPDATKLEVSTPRATFSSTRDREHGNSGAWLRPPKPPRDRHGRLVHTTAGGAGNSSGIAKLREGPWPIWFMLDDGMLTAKSTWCGVAAIAASGSTSDTVSTLAESAGAGCCSHILCATLSRLEVDLQYEELVGLIERVLKPRIEREARNDLDAIQWRQFVVAITLLATRACTQQRYPLALSLIRKAEHCVECDLDMTSATRKELEAFISDAHAYYLAHRERYSSALDCSRKASKLHRALGQYVQLAKSRLHTAAILSRMRKHKEALKYVDQIMQMVDDGVLETGGATSEKLTLVAVAYHNKAVDLLLSGHPQEACVAMQAVQRLQKLCAGSCGSFRDDFEWTQYSVLRALTTTAEVKALMRGMPAGAVLQKLAEDLFSE